MLCKNCNIEIPENMTTCPKCGTAFPLTEEPTVAPRGFSAKKNIIIIMLAALLVLGVGTAVTAFAVTHSPSYQVSHGLKLAERYLSEQNYQQAVIEFLNILEIEPMNADAYLGLADAYIGLGDTDKAIEVLREGLDKTGDPRIQAKLDELLKSPDEIENPPVSSSSTTSESKPEETSAPEYGSMGFATIGNTEVDIATTTNLMIYNREIFEERRNSHENGFHYLTALSNPENYSQYQYVFLTSSLTENDYENIGKLSELKFLHIEYAGLTDVTSLVSSIENLNKLNSLDLAGNQISDASPIINKLNIQSLDLDFNQISDVSPFLKMNQLKTFSLDNNPVSDLTPLYNMTQLTSLSLSGYQLTDITWLANFTELSNLTLNHNQISNVAPLANLTNLSYLSLQNNNISDLNAFTGLSKLKLLYLTSNQISDIALIADHTDLTHLLLDSNQISDITPLAKLEKLVDLRLRNNQISDSDLEWLKTQLPNCNISF